MSDEQRDLIHTASEGGVAATHPPSDDYAVVVGPKTTNEFNRIRSWLVPVACWRVDDIRFSFDSSFVQPEVKIEMAHLVQLMNKHPECPLSIFGHADPTGDDSYNKTLSGRRAKAIYSLFICYSARDHAVHFLYQTARADDRRPSENKT